MLPSYLAGPLPPHGASLSRCLAFLFCFSRKTSSPLRTGSGLRPQHPLALAPDLQCALKCKALSPTVGAPGIRAWSHVALRTYDGLGSERGVGRGRMRGRQHTGRAPEVPCRVLDLNPPVMGGPGDTLQPGPGNLLRVSSRKCGLGRAAGAQAQQLRGRVLIHSQLWSLH